MENSKRDIFSKRDSLEENSISEIEPKIKMVFGTEEDVEALPRDIQIERESSSRSEGEDDISIDFGRTKFNYDKLKEEVREGQSKLLLAKSEGKLIGFISYTTPEHSEPNFIQLMWVDQDHRREGIGEKLLKEVMENMPDSEISLNVWSNESKNFFEKHGFVSNPRKDHTNRYTRRDKTEQKEI